MKNYIVSLNLKTQRNCQPLFDEIEKLNGIKVFENVWSFKLPNKSTCRGLFRRLVPFVELFENGLIVTEIVNHSCMGVEKFPHVFDK
ncbi:MAG: hypothetical protein QM800_04240 [Paludibacter sp.]